MNNEIPGNLHVSQEVLIDLVGKAAQECYGIVDMAPVDETSPLARLVPGTQLRRGVVVTRTDGGVHVELYVIVEYGTNISVVSKNLTDSVEFMLKQYVQLEVDSVEVHVQGVKVRK